MKYYGVVSSYYDDGNVHACLVDVIDSYEKPANSRKETRRCDVYVDWFNTEEEAREFVNECKKECAI